MEPVEAQVSSLGPVQRVSLSFGSHRRWRTVHEDSLLRRPVGARRKHARIDRPDSSSNRAGLSHPSSRVLTTWREACHKSDIAFFQSNAAKVHASMHSSHPQMQFSDFDPRIPSRRDRGNTVRQWRLPASKVQDEGESRSGQVGMGREQTDEAAPLGRSGQTNHLLHHVLGDIVPDLVARCDTRGLVEREVNSQVDSTLDRSPQTPG